jgi:hypothetical protein
MIPTVYNYGKLNIPITALNLERTGVKYFFNLDLKGKFSVVGLPNSLIKLADDGFTTL